jgi:hypothetical protein
MYCVKGLVLSLLVTAHVSAFVQTIRPIESRSVNVARSLGVEFADIVVPGVAFFGAVAASIYKDGNPELGSTLAIEVSGAAPAAVSTLEDSTEAAATISPETPLALTSEEAAPVEVTSEKQGIARKCLRVVKKVVAPWRKWEVIN